MKKKRYEIQKAVIELNDGNKHQRYFITEHFIPLLEINQYLEQKSIRSTRTGKQYAKKIVVYLNWLNQRGSAYEEATPTNI